MTKEKKKAKNSMKELCKSLRIKKSIRNPFIIGYNSFPATQQYQKAEKERGKNSIKEKKILTGK